MDTIEKESFSKKIQFADALVEEKERNERGLVSDPRQNAAFLIQALTYE